ncbi:MerR family transcriptional regulator [Kaistia sp. UC242_56]|uniref:MerR family transcriptional regulator n=1 Tax=Kaistia sp. UC242_56 TaxID=3374625 RepID=UPI0037901249
MRRYSIGELASEFNLTPRTLRFWEEAALLFPIRPGTHRVYTEADRQWVQKIVSWSAAGLTLREIKAIRDMSETEIQSFLHERLPAIQAALDEEYAKRCRAIKAVLATISEPRRATA